MKKILNTIKPWIMSHKKSVCGAITVIILLSFTILFLFINQKETIELKQDTFNVAVKTTLDVSPESYLKGMKHVDEAKVNAEAIDMNKLGTYDLVITYKEQDYTVKIKVQDLEKPILKVAQEAYVFPLDSTIEEVNELINKDITITDNYDIEFETLDFVSEIPEVEKEIKIKLSAIDSSKNESEVVRFTIQFTEDGETKDGLEIEEKEVLGNVGVKKEEPVSTPETEEESTPEEEPISPEVDSTPEPTPPVVKPTPEPTPPPVATTPEPTPPVVKPTPEPEPEEPTYTTPEGAYDGGIFATKEAGRIWTRSHTDNPDSPYYHCMSQGNQLSNGTWHFYIDAPQK